MNGQILISGISLQKLKSPKTGNVKIKFFLHKTDTIASSEFFTKVKKKQEDEIWFPDEFKIPVCLEKYYEKKKKTVSSLTSELGLKPALSVVQEKPKKKKRDDPTLSFFVTTKKMIGNVKIAEKFEDVYKKFGKLTFTFPMSSGEDFVFDVEYTSAEKKRKKIAADDKAMNENLKIKENLHKNYKLFKEADLINLVSYLNCEEFWKYRRVNKFWKKTIEKNEEYFKKVTKKEVMRLLSLLKKRYFFSPVRSFEKIEGKSIGSGKLSQGFLTQVKSILQGRKFTTYSMFRFSDQHILIVFKNEILIKQIDLKCELRVIFKDDFPVGELLLDYQPTVKVFEKSINFRNFTKKITKDTPMKEMKQLSLKFSNNLNCRKLKKFDISIFGFNKDDIKNLEESSPIKTLFKTEDFDVFRSLISILSEIYKHSKEITREMKIHKKSAWYYKSNFEINSEVWKMVFQQFKNTEDLLLNELIDTIILLLSVEKNEKSMEKAGGFEELFKSFNEFCLLKENKPEINTKTFQRFIEEFSFKNPDSLHLLNILMEMSISKGPSEIKKKAVKRIVFMLPNLSVGKEKMIDICNPIIKFSPDSEAVIQALKNIEKLDLSIEDLYKYEIFNSYVQLMDDICQKKRTNLKDDVENEVKTKISNIYYKNEKEKPNFIKNLIDRFIESEIAVKKLLDEILTSDKNVKSLIIKFGKESKHFPSLLSTLSGEWILTLFEEFKITKETDFSEIEKESVHFLNVIEKYIETGNIYKPEEKNGKQKSFEFLLLFKHILLINKKENEHTDKLLKLLIAKQTDPLESINVMNQVILKYYS